MVHIMDFRNLLAVFNLEPPSWLALRSRQDPAPGGLDTVFIAFLYFNPRARGTALHPNPVPFVPSTEGAVLGTIIQRVEDMVGDVHFLCTEVGESCSPGFGAALLLRFLCPLPFLVFVVGFVTR